jgi:RHS repeat-associated protein
MYDDDGKKTWSAELDIYGRVRTFDGRSLNDCPFRYQGQYEDAETGLYYNRFRYYDPTIGSYLSQDPIGLTGGDKLYGYVHDTNICVDIWGLYESVSFPANKVIHETTIQMQGSNNWDFKLANDQVGLFGVKGNATAKAHKQAYGDVVWHHASYDPVTNKAKMQLVTTADHNATFPHEGAVKQFREHNKVEEYGSADAKNKAAKLNKKH